MSRQNIRPALPSIGLRLACNEIPAENESARLLFGLTKVTIDCLEEGTFLGNTPEIVIKNSLADNIQSHFSANTLLHIHSMFFFRQRIIKWIFARSPIIPTIRFEHLFVEPRYKSASSNLPYSGFIGKLTSRNLHLRKFKQKTASFPPYSSNNSAMNIKLASPETHLTVDCCYFYGLWRSA